jgi:hypothetical protein
MDQSTYYFDFSDKWFSSFVPPKVVENGELEIVQVRCQRAAFLDSFYFYDENELEFLVDFSNDGCEGKIKVIKTREIVIVEAHVPFEIEDTIVNDDNFEFPDETLLINANH